MRKDRQTGLLHLPNLAPSLRGTVIIPRSRFRTFHKMTEQVIPPSLRAIAAEVAQLLKERKETISVAETAAGGLISAALLSTPGASELYLSSLDGLMLREWSRRHLQGWTDCRCTLALCPPCNSFNNDTLYLTDGSPAIHAAITNPVRRLDPSHHRRLQGPYTRNCGWLGWKRQSETGVHVLRLWSEWSMIHEAVLLSRSCGLSPMQVMLGGVEN